MGLWVGGSRKLTRFCGVALDRVWFGELDVSHCVGITAFVGWRGFCSENGLGMGPGGGRTGVLKAVLE